jgi:transcriptional regulator with XRE-family HTH domain
MFHEGGDNLSDNVLGKRLKELRIVNNYTQDFVAGYINKTRQTYSHYETGRRKVSTETIYKIAALYNVSVDDLLHLSLTLDEDVFYDMPGTTQSSTDLSAYLEYFNDPKNRKKYQYNSNLEKELLYYFQKLTNSDKQELIEIAKIKAKKNDQ